MKRGLTGDNVWVVTATSTGRPQEMLYAGLDLSRQRLDVHILDEEGSTVELTAVRPDGDALRTLVAHIGRHGQQDNLEAPDHRIRAVTGQRVVPLTMAPLHREAPCQVPEIR